MKKRLSALLAGILSIAMLSSVSAFAAEQSLQSALKSAEQYAYLDPDTSPELKEEILDARNTIIFSQDWVADGLTGYIENVETGEIIKELPAFSSLFPDWDIPVLDPATESKIDIFKTGNLSKAAVIPPTDLSSWIRLGSFSKYLKVATSVAATPFVSFTMDPLTMGTSVRSYATELTSSETCNIGISNANTGASYATGTYLSINEAVVVNGLYYTDIAVRASTYSDPGWSTIAIDGANRAIQVR